MAPSLDGFTGEVRGTSVDLNGFEDASRERCAMVLGLATAVPANEVLQTDYPDFYFKVTNSDHKLELKKKFARICERSEVKRRFMFLTEDVLRANPNLIQFGATSLNERIAIATEEVPKMAKEASLKAIKDWGGSVSEITHIVFATTTGVDIPGADHALSRLLGLRADVRRVMLYQVGCHGGVSAMRIAKDMAENNKGARVLAVTSEMTCMTFQPPNENHIDKLVSAALFGDGAAALIIGSDPRPGLERPLYEIRWAGQTALPNSTNVVGGSMTDAGMMFHLSKDVPDLIGKNLEKFLVQACKSSGTSDWNDMFWAVHPGGPAILNNIADNLRLNNHKLDASRETLSNYGNMNSSTVLFILNNIRQRSAEQGHDNTGLGLQHGFVIGFGPGLTMEAIVLKSLEFQPQRDI